MAVLSRAIMGLPIGVLHSSSPRTVMEEVLHIMQAAYGFSMHNEACRRRTNNKACALSSDISGNDACSALLLLLLLFLLPVWASYREEARIRKRALQLYNYTRAIRRNSKSSINKSPPLRKSLSSETFRYTYMR